jgi:hypothetical protein
MKILSNILILLILLNIKAQTINFTKTPSTIQVNQVTNYEEKDGIAASLSNGNIVIAWLDELTMGGYNIYFNLYDSTGVMKTTNPILVSDPAPYKLYRPWVVADNNGGFVITWGLDNSPKYNYIYIRQYDATLTPGVIKKVNDDPVGMRSDDGVGILPVIDILANGYFIIAWNILNSTKCIWAQILDSQLNAKVKNFAVPDNTCDFGVTFGLTALDNGFVVIVAGINETFVKQYDLTGQSTKGAVVIHSNTWDGSPGAAQLKNGNIVFVYYNEQNEIKYQIYDKNIIPTNDPFSVSISTNIQYSCVVKALSFGGFAVVWNEGVSNIAQVFLQVFDENGNVVGSTQMVNTLSTYDMLDPKLTEIKSDGRIIVTWYGGAQVKAYNVWAQFFAMDSSSGSGTPTGSGPSCIDLSIFLDKQQLKIKIIFPLTLSTVFIRSLPIMGKLVDNSNSLMLIGSSYTIDNLYYTYTAQNKDIFTYSLKIPGNSCSINMLICYQSCLTCSGEGSSTNHNCTQCNTNYYPLFDNKNNCYLSTDLVNNYKFDLASQMFISSTTCYKSCSICSGNGSDSQHNCLICNTNYFPLSDNITMCFQSDSLVLGYYFNSQQKEFDRCSYTCQTCFAAGNVSNSNCIICASDFYPLVDIKSNCFKSNTSVTGYYFDTNENIFNKCFSSCSTCSGPGDAFSPNCNACVAGYTTCNGCTSYVYKDSCVNKCPALTSLNTNTKMCIDCNAGEVVYNNQCVKVCPFGFVNDLYTCIDCKANNLFKFNNQCVQSCPENTITDIENNLCYSCNDRSLLYYNSTCVATCPEGTINSNSVCESCTSVNRYFYNNQCVDICPDGYTPDKGICVAKEQYLSSNFYMVCQTDTCLNGGICSIQYNTLSCSCTSSYTGEYCQLENKNEAISNYISIS